MLQKTVSGRSYLNSRLRKLQTDTTANQESLTNNLNLQTRDSLLKTSSEDFLGILEKQKNSTKSKIQSDSAKSQSARKCISRLKSSNLNENFQTDLYLISTTISDLVYYHSSDIDPIKLCHHPPLGSNNLKVILVEDYLFYMNTNIQITSHDLELLIKHLSGLTNHVFDVTSWNKKEYLIKIVTQREISLENHRDIIANSIEIKYKILLHYTFLNKQAEKMSQRESLLAKKIRDFEQTGRLVSDQLNTDEEWTMDGWLKGVNKNLNGSNRMIRSKTTQNISPKSDLSSPSVLKKTDINADFREISKSSVEVKKRHFNILSYLSLQKKPSLTSSAEVLPVSNLLYEENVAVAETKSPKLHKKMISKINSQVESLLISKRPNKLSVNVAEIIDEYKCCEFGKDLVDVNKNANSTQRVWRVKEDVKKLVKKKAVEWKEVKMNLVDTHCHFEMLFSRIRYKKSVEEYFTEFSSIYLDNFEACINVICDPSKFSNNQRLNDTLQTVKHPKVYSTIGCHPHFADTWNVEIEKLIQSVLNHPRIVAIGECGLDHSRKNQVDIKFQLKAFKAQLKIAYDTKKPIVIHCRNREELVLEIMKEFLHPSHKIHLHCFTGGWEIGKLYLDHFPNLCIGVTSLVTFKSNTLVRELVEKIPIERILLETDAPYFVPRTNEFPLGVEVCHPGFIFAAAEEVASLKSVSVNTLIEKVRENVASVYGF